MAEQDGSKTEQATARRKAEAREKGQVAVSREVPTAVILLGGIALLYALTGPALTGLTQVMREWFELAPRTSLTPDTFHALMVKLSLDSLRVILPVIGSIAALAVASYLLQTGFLWPAEGLKIDPNRLNPLEGFKKVLSLRSVVELIKALVKVTVIGWVGVTAIRQEIGVLPELVTYDLPGVLAVIGHLVLKMCLWIAGTVAVIAAGDYAYQRFEWERSLRMSKHEVKKEHKESEGDPLIKSRVRSLQREMARNRMMAAVPKADVVITNPTHLAVALKYDQQAMGAPVVVAKGAGYVAQRIKEIATEHGVMVIENKPVAQTLFKLVDIGREIPTDLYRAVAEILALVYRAKGKGLGARGTP